jgi:PAS domain S-box-containing protein
MEVELHETEQMHRLLLNSSSDVIIKLAIDLKITEFNPEAEKFFGIKRNDAVNHNYIQALIPEMVRKKTEKELNKLLNETPDSNLKMQVITAGGNMPVVDWSVHILHNNIKMPSGVILIAKKIMMTGERNFKLSTT